VREGDSVCVTHRVTHTLCDRERERERDSEREEERMTNNGIRVYASEYETLVEGKETFVDQ